jgi:hypothetical protein
MGTEVSMRLAVTFPDKDLTSDLQNFSAVRGISLPPHLFPSGRPIVERKSGAPRKWPNGIDTGRP